MALAGPKRQRILVDIAPTSPAAEAMYLVAPVGQVSGAVGNPAGQSYPQGNVLQKGQPFSIIVVTMNGVGPFTYSATGMPAGTSIASDGTWSGNPTTQGYGVATITSLDTGNGNLPTVQTVSWNVAGSIALYGTLPQATAQNAYQASVLCVGATGAVTWSQTGLPAGLTIAPATGLITGTYATAAGGTFLVAITASDAGTGTTVTQNYQLVIARAPGATGIGFYNSTGGIVSSFPKCVAGAPFVTQALQVNSIITLNPAGTAPVSWSATGLPTGLVINSLSGIISGQTTDAQAAGVYAITITAIDFWGATSVRTLNLTVLNAIGLLTSNQMVVGNSVGQPQSVNFFSLFFGDASDGDAVLDGTTSYPWAVLTGGNKYTLKRPIYLGNLTLNSGITLDCNGMDVYGTGRADLTNASANSILYSAPSAGGAGTGLGGGGGGAPNASARTLGVGGAGANGGAGTLTNGTDGANSNALQFGNGGDVNFSGATAGDGGTGTGGAIGNAGIAGAVDPRTGYPMPFGTLQTAKNGPINGGVGGAGGGAGAGDGTNKGGSGGGGAAGACVGMFCFYEIMTAGTTVAPVFTILPAPGGAGQGLALTNCGAGGGGMGGGGGYWHIRYAIRTGTPIAGLIACDGGNGGVGGTNSANAARNGHGGDAGHGGVVEIINVLTSAAQTFTETTAPTAPSGVTGGVGGKTRVAF